MNEIDKVQLIDLNDVDALRRLMLGGKDKVFFPSIGDVIPKLKMS